MPVKLKSVGGGDVTLDVPNTGSTFTATFPAVNGNVVTTGDTGTVSSTMIAASAVTPVKLSQPLTLMTANVISGSPTSLPYTDIPSWVRRITIMFSGVSLSASANIVVRIGDSGGIENTGYVSTSAVVVNAAATAVANDTTGFVIRMTAAAAIFSGHMVLTNATGNLWISSHSGKTTTTNAAFGGGDKTLSDTLTQLTITSTSTDSFDAGTVNVLYEG